MDKIINKIRKIKESRLKDDEKYILNIINNLKYVYIQQWDKTSEIYTYDGDIIILKKKIEKIIYVNDFIWEKLKLDFGYNNNEILKLVSHIIKNYLSWDGFVIKPFDKYDFNIINDGIKSGEVK